MKSLLDSILLALALQGALNAQPISTPVTSAVGAPWKRHTIDAGSRGADGVKLGDLNGDGLPDIVTGWEEGGAVRAYLNPGPMKARERWPTLTVGEVKDVEEAIFADLDGDGRLEVISGTEGNTRTLYWHREAAGHWRTDSFPATAGTQMWMQAAALDIDGQFGADLLLGSKNKGAALGWLQAPEKPDNLESWSYHKLRDASWLMSLIPADLNGDGDLDVIFTDRKGPRPGVFWLQHPGPEHVQKHAAWPEHLIGATGREVMFADLGDVNADGLLDLAVAVKPHDVLLFVRKADGGWTESVMTLLSDSLGDAKAVKIGDLNHDGLADLVFTCENAHGPREGVVWLEQQQSRSWLQHSLGGPDGVKFDLIQLLDLDADGDLDVITCEERDQLGVVWYQNPLK